VTENAYKLRPKIATIARFTHTHNNKDTRMNQDYRSIYNAQTNTYVAVSSNTPARGKTASARTNIRRCAFALGAIAALMAPVSGAWADCKDTASEAYATNGSNCTLSLPKYTAVGTGIQLFRDNELIYVGGSFSINGTRGGATLNMNNVTVESSVSNIIGISIMESQLISTGDLTFNFNGVDDSALYFVGSSGRLNNLTINGVNGRGFAVENINSQVNISGHTQIDLDSGAGIAVTGLALGGRPAEGASLTLNTANVNINGNLPGYGVESTNRGKITATGQVNIFTTGAQSAALVSDEGGDVQFTNGGKIASTGDKSVAVLFSSGSIDQEYDDIRADNQIALNNYQLSSSQGDVVAAYGGTSHLTLNNTEAAAADSKNLIYVSNGSDALVGTLENLEGEGEFTPNAANFTLNANASTLSGNITVAADGSAATLNFNNGSTYTGTMSNVTRSTLDASSRWNMTGNSTITQTLNNAGTVYFKNLGQTLTTANYVGTAGSVISLETKLGDDNSTTDKLYVTGNTSGSTRLEIRNAGGTGAQTVNGINVVQVDGTSAADSFTMAAPVQAGAYEYTLKQGSALDANDWYLTSQSTTTLYRPAVAAYVVAQTANTDATFDLMSSLHQRMGEQRGTSGAPQTWGKIFTAGQSNNGKNRFEYDQFSTGFQFGRDVWSNNTSRAGVTLNYAYSDIDARDSARAQENLAQNTGTIKSTALGLGGYFTQHMSNGMYVDVVGQANHITNKFNDSYSGQSKQKGWQAGLSTEIGKTVGNIGGWNVEPQAQLSYAYGNYKNFADAYSTIGNDNTNSLRGRLGVRLFKDLNISGQAAQYYGIANIGHDFIKPKNVTLSDRTGSTTLNERFDNTYAEIGAGVSGQVSKTTSLHADARYQRSFKGNKEGAHLDVGVKVQF
jgi:autotransporter family porin